MKTEFQPRKTHAGFKWKASAAQNAPTPVDATRVADLDTLAQLVSRPVVQAIGLEWYGWHGFRRGIASNLYELGADEKVVQRVLRHTKAHVTRGRYIKAFDPAVLSAMKRMETTLDAMNSCAPTVHQIN